MDPFSYKADLEAQALQEWIEVIHKNLVRCLLRALVRSVRRLLRGGYRRASNARRIMLTIRHAIGLPKSRFREERV
jgi:hypothetical protein